MHHHDRVLSMLGLAKKAGRIAAGQFQSEEAVKSRKAQLVIVSADASANTAKKFRDMCAWRSIPFRLYTDMETLGRSIGCEDRSVLAVTDRGFSQRILQLLEDCEKNDCLSENTEGMQ